MNVTQKDIVGVWKLNSFIQLDVESQKNIYPYGKNPQGYIIYMENGFVSVHIMNASRPFSNSPEFKADSIEQKVEIADNYGGYIGRYELKSGMIIHYPEVCGFPSFLNTPQERYPEIIDGRFILRCYPNNDSSFNSSSTVIWERIH